MDELEDKPDFIVLDPPRDGIHPKAIQKIIDFGVNEWCISVVNRQVWQEIWKYFKKQGIK